MEYSYKYNVSNKIHFLNHTSFLIEHDKYFLLLDPWPTDALSFDGWKSHPPCYLNDNILAAFMNEADNVAVIISHGHDDHCDDSFLKKIKKLPVFFPEYKSKGALKRIGSKIENIKTITPLKELTFGPYKISCYIYSEYSDDDAVITIETNDYLLVHANDNSIKFDNELIKFIKKKGKNKKIYFASQTGIANGFPYCYPQYFKKNINSIEKIAIEKTKESIQIAINNANEVNADKFISYAAYTLSMPLLNRNISQFLSSPKNLKSLRLNWGCVSLIDFVPGDILNIENNEIIKPFWTQSITFEKLCDGIRSLRLDEIKYFNKDLEKKSFKFIKKFNDDHLIKYAKNYFNEFLNYIQKQGNSVQKELGKTIIEFSIENIGSIFLNFSSREISSDSQSPNKKILISRKNAWLLVSGILNHESLYIGHNALFERFPKHYFNKELMKQLEIFGYIYQKRLVPSELSSLVN